MFFCQEVLTKVLAFVFLAGVQPYATKPRSVGKDGSMIYEAETLLMPVKSMLC